MKTSHTHIEGHGTAIVLLHSSMSSKKQWREFVSGMRASYRLIAIDLAPYATGRFTLDDEVRLVEWVLSSALDVDERFHLVGHSYGGVVALHLAQGKPASVRSLTLFEPIPFHLLPAHDPVMAEMFSVHQQIQVSLRNDEACSGTAAFVDYWSGRGTYSQMTGERQDALCKMLPKTVLEIQAVATETLPAERYKQIVAPACLITGRQSPRAAHVATDVLARLLPNATRFQVDAGHLAPATHPQLVNPIIEGFIRGVDRRPHSFNFDSSIRYV